MKSTQFDTDNSEFIEAFTKIQDSNDNIYLTGKAGTGKTTFLRYIKSEVRKTKIVLAPTGIASINAGGQTINSFFHLPFRPFNPNERIFNTYSGVKNFFRYNQVKINLIKNMQLLIIDEISMVRCDIIDVIDNILRKIRNKNESFGGVQVLFIGDLYQLPPVVKQNERDILLNFYTNTYFFNSNAYHNGNFSKIELKKIYRQSDIEFIDILNRIRLGEHTVEDINKLNSKKDTTKLSDNFVTLSTHNTFVDEINKNELNNLPSELHMYKALVKGDFNVKLNIVDDVLMLKVGAQVMFTKNDSETGRYYNGKLGVVESLGNNFIKVKDKDGNIITVTPDKWENIKYSYNGKEIIEDKLGYLKQYPIKLAWAITVHKSQGLTFDSVMLDLQNSFTHGQVYVALSRCTNMDSMVLINDINYNSIVVDDEILEFTKNI